MYFFIGNARKKDKYKRMKQQEAKKELKKKGIGGGGKAGGKVTPFTGTAQTVGKQQLGTIMNSSLFFLFSRCFIYNRTRWTTNGLFFKSEKSKLFGKCHSMGNRCPAISGPQRSS